MASMNGNHVAQDVRREATSRRALLATGAGWVLGASGLLLPAAIDEAVGKGNKGNKDNKRKNDKKGKKGNGDQGKSGGKGGTDQGGGAQAEGLFKDVRITFVNGSSATVQLALRDNPTGGDVAPGARVVSTAPGLVRDKVATLETEGGRYVIYAQNPTVGLPWIKILDSKAGGQVVNEDLAEGEQVDADRFRVRRLTDSDAREFVLTYLGAPGETAATSADVTTAEANGGKGGKKGGKGKKGGMGSKDGSKGGQNQGGQDTVPSEVGNNEGGEVQAQSFGWLELTIVNGSSQNVELEIQPVWDNPRSSRTEVLGPNEKTSSQFSNPSDRGRISAQILGRGYSLQAVSSGDPYVYIHNGFTGLNELSQVFKEPGEMETKKFKVRRLPDTGRLVNFEITIKEFSNADK